MLGTKLHQKTDFTNKNIYVGMDIHKKSWSISLYLEQDYLRTFNQPPTIKALTTLLHRDYPGASYTCAYEAGLFGFWIHRELQSAGIDCRVFHPADIPQPGKRKTIKRDPIDSRSIAQALSLNLVSGIYVPGSEIEQDRSLIRYRARLQRDIRRSKVRINGLLFQFGISIPDHLKTSWSQKFMQWLKDIEHIPGTAHLTLHHMIEQLELLRGMLLKVNRDIRTLQKSEKYKRLMDLLMSIPGIGPLAAIILITELADIKRFKTFRQLNAFVGLYPMEYSSGENDYKGSITIRKNSFLRCLLVESAWVAARHDPALTRDYHEWKQRMTKKRAIIKVARKLLSRIRHVWINEELYIKGIAK